MKTLLFFSGLCLCLTGCQDTGNPGNDKTLTKSLASKEANPEAENPILSIEPSENVNLEDYWEEAKSINAEARQILTLSGNINCEEASSFARQAIDITNQTLKSTSLPEAESLIGKAGEIVQHAENALVLCQDQASE